MLSPKTETRPRPSVFGSRRTETYQIF